MVGTIAGAGHFAASLLAAAFVVGTNLLLRPLVRRINRLSITTADAETFYTVQIVGRLSLEPQVSGTSWQVDRSEVIVAATRARAQAMRRGRASLWRGLARLPDVAHARAQDVVGVGAGEVAVVAEVQAGALGNRRVGAQAQHHPIARR